MVRNKLSTTHNRLVWTGEFARKVEPLGAELMMQKFDFVALAPCSIEFRNHPPQKRGKLANGNLISSQSPLRLKLDISSVCQTGGKSSRRMWLCGRGKNIRKFLQLHETLRHCLAFRKRILSAKKTRAERETKEKWQKHDCYAFFPRFSFASTRTLRKRETEYKKRTESRLQAETDARRRRFTRGTLSAINCECHSVANWFLIVTPRDEQRAQKKAR